MITVNKTAINCIDVDTTSMTKLHYNNTTVVHSALCVYLHVECTAKQRSQTRARKITNKWSSWNITIDFIIY